VKAKLNSGSTIRMPPVRNLEGLLHWTMLMMQKWAMLMQVRPMTSHIMSTTRKEVLAGPRSWSLRRQVTCLGQRQCGILALCR
jgi:hypothetical protein